MDRMEAAERAEILRAFQVYGTNRSQAAGIDQADVYEVVRQSLNPRRTKKGPSKKARALVSRTLGKRSQAE